MSALLERPETRGPKTAPRRNRPRISPAKPKAEVRLSARVIRSHAPNIPLFLAKKALILGLVMGGTWTASSFCGQVLLEGARQQKMQAITRAKEARAAEEMLTAKLIEIKSIEGIEAWALAHGFEPLDVQKPSNVEGLIARR